MVGRREPEGAARASSSTGAASRLVSAPWLVPIAGAPIREGAVLLDEDDRVLAVGPRAAVRAQAPSVPETRATGALLPGLVNAHVHLELSGLRGEIAGGDGLVGWVGRLLPKAGQLTPARRHEAGRAAIASMRAAGTVGIGEVCNDLGGMSLLAGSGLQGVVFHELLGSREQRTGDALADAQREREQFLREWKWPLGFAYVPAPHAPYSVSPPLLRRIFAEARHRGRATSVHVAEDPDELALLFDESGRWPELLRRMGVPPRERTSGLSPVGHLAAAGAFEGGRPPLLVHMVHASAEDRRLAAASQATVVLCPRSNLHVGGRLPDVPALLREGISLALGTDSLASTPDLSLWGEIRTLAAAFPALAPEVWLQAATRQGAGALGLEELGALSPGRRPGLLDVQVPAVTSASAPELLRSLCLDPSLTCAFLSPSPH